MTSCLTCAHSALRDPADDKRDRTLREMARHGSINCTISPARASFYRCDMPACPKYEPAPADVAAARVRWNDAQKATTVAEKATA